jgi:hypothetical protein
MKGKSEEHQCGLQHTGAATDELFCRRQSLENSGIVQHLQICMGLFLKKNSVLLWGKV